MEEIISLKEELEDIIGVIQELEKGMQSLDVMPKSKLFNRLVKSSQISEYWKNN